MLPVFGRPPFLDILAYGFGEVRPQFEQSLKGFTGGITFSELPVGRGQCRLRTPVAGEIGFEHEIQCVRVIALAVGVVEIGVPVPTWMVGIELLGALRQGHASLPVARISYQLAEKR